jgi:hypothetical protein
MSATADDADDPDTLTAKHGLSPERRLDAIADIVVRGLARVLLAEDAATAADVARDVQVLGNTSESALLIGSRDALMVRRGEEPAAKGGRTR